MPDSGDTIDPVDTAGKGKASPGLGERLRKAREARNLSLEQVSESLHLDAAVLRSIEEEHFQTLGAPVFVRGHLRSYAQILGLDVEQVLADYRAADPSSTVAPKLAQSSDRSVTVNPFNLAAYILVGLVAGALALYLLLGDSADDEAAVPANEPSAEIQ